LEESTEESTQEAAENSTAGSTTEESKTEDSTSTRTSDTTPPLSLNATESAARGAHGKHLKKRKRNGSDSAGKGKKHKDNNGVVVEKGIADSVIISPPKDRDLKAKVRKMRAKDVRTQRKFTEEEKTERRGAEKEERKQKRRASRKLQEAEESERLEWKEKEKEDRVAGRGELRKKTNVGLASMTAEAIIPLHGDEPKKALSKKEESKYRRKAARKGITFEDLMKKKEKKSAKKTEARAKGRTGNVDD
jgi:hypothetical protein